jgi:hypothetical protein
MNSKLTAFAFIITISLLGAYCNERGTENANTQQDSINVTDTRRYTTDSGNFFTDTSTNQ